MKLKMNGQQRCTPKNILTCLLIAGTSAGAAAFVVVPSAVTFHHQKQSQQHHCCLYATVGIFFGTSTGNTQDCADKFYEALQSKDVDVAEPIDIDTVDAGSLKNVFSEYDSLIVGTPTWNTNADTFRSGTGWDDLYYDKLPDLTSILSSKKVAVFGLGDQISYGENYADATGELYSVFESLGCDMVSYAHTSQDGYDHITSKSILPGTDLFCGLLLDQINQDDLTDTRIANWIETLQDGGFFNTDGSASLPKVAVTIEADEDDEDDDDDDDHIDSTIGSDVKETVATAQIPLVATGSNYTPHYNSKTGRTMWTSPDGRSSYVTTEPMQSTLRS